MTVTEAYVGGVRLDTSHGVEQVSSTLTSLLIEGIALNTTGSVFEPEVVNLLLMYLFDILLK